MKKMLMIINPKSGKSQIKPQLCDIIDMYTAQDYDVTVHTTQCQRDAYKVALNRGADFDIIVCSGGDGTLDEVGSGILGIPEANRPILGYIPAGTTNDFAKSLGIVSDVYEAAKNVIEGVPYACDMGQFNGKPFIYVAAFGLFTQVSYATPQEVKNAWGHLAYVMEGIKSLTSIKSYKVRCTCGDKVIEDDFIYGMVTNSISVGGFKSISGKVMALDDGLLEVLLVKTPKNILDWQGLIGALIGQKVDDRYMYLIKADKVSFSSEEDIGWTLDGEDGGQWQECEIINLKQALCIVRPEDAVLKETDQKEIIAALDDKIDIIKTDNTKEIEGRPKQ